MFSYQNACSKLRKITSRGKWRFAPPDADILGKGRKYASMFSPCGSILVPCLLFSGVIVGEEVLWGMECLHSMGCSLQLDCHLHFYATSSSTEVVPGNGTLILHDLEIKGKDEKQILLWKDLERKYLPQAQVVRIEKHLLNDDQLGWERIAQRKKIEQDFI